MDEELVQEEQSEKISNVSMRSEYKKTCLKLGFFITLMLVLRELAPIAMGGILNLLHIEDHTAIYVIQLTVSALFLQIIPAIVGAFMLRYRGETLKNGYKIPPRNLKAISNFSAIYGFAMTVNIITLIVASIITSNTNAQQALGPMNSVTPGSTVEALIMFVLLVVIAPIFEEFIFRGCVLNVLKPYGNGIAVFVSAFLFGAMHGNFQQFFYAFAIGIPLGYIAIATNSIFSATIIHAIVNSISGILLILISTDEVSALLGGNFSNTNNAPCIIFVFFLIVVLAMALIGFILMIKKFMRIKKFSLPLVWNEISNGKKVMLLILNPGMVLSVILFVDVFFFNVITMLLSKALFVS